MKKKKSKTKKRSKVEKIKSVGKEINKTIDKLGKSTTDILKKIETADKEMDKKMKEILGSVDKF